MPAIVVKAFGGMRPIVEPHLLDPSESVLAQNVRLISGAVQPLRGSTVLRSLNVTAPKTIWRFGNSTNESEWWLEFANQTDVIRSPIPSDSWGRTYWTDGATPKYAPSTLLLSGTGAYPGASYTLGVPAPTAAPSIFGAASSEPSAETRSYVYTYVSAFGEEGPPSPPSPPQTLNPDLAVTVSSMQTGPSGAYSITLKRIYRTSAVGSSAQFQFVTEIPVATTSYVDTVAQASLGEVLATEDWQPPPAGLRGLKMLANGGAIGFVGNTVYTTEPNLPHAWAHSTAIEDTIVGIGVFRQGAALLTNGHPYIFTGADPGAMTPERLERPLACLSRESIVDTGDGCLYASSEGLVSVGAGGAEVATKRLISQAQWHAYDPSSMVGAVIEGRYHCLYTTSGGQRGMLIFDFEGGGAVFTVSNINEATAITAMYADPRTGNLYMAQGGNIVRYDRGSALSGVWRSGIYRLASPANMACFAVDAASYPVTLRVFADGAMVHTASVASRFAQRLPAGFEATEWSFELEGSAKMTRIVLATSMSELKEAL
jgi:hypothetical protein